ncbi:PRKR-interacting protein 1 [Balaenoptera musculus]|uniref:PRKR-interacting protein 1 n=2 Tax=Balaenoptera TaxID=9766 RepID=A0A8C0D3I8_BALMU|nr:PRKR-interacting protein 1 [Balaenoptera musculus]
MASSAASSVRPPRPKKEPQALVIPKNAAEEQKLKLERLMKNPDKTVPIPEKMSEWAPRPPPEFVRDVMGSSAGAGSGEFHVYRHLRRREYQRQDYMDAMAEKQKLDAEFQKRLEKNKIAAEEQTAKRRKKRQKLKEKKLLAKKMKLEQKKQKEGPSPSQEQPSSGSEAASGTEEGTRPASSRGGDGVGHGSWLEPGPLCDRGLRKASTGLKGKGATSVSAHFPSQSLTG